MKTPLMLLVNGEPGLLSGVPGSLCRSGGMRLCGVENCERKHEARGFCQAHYARLCKGTDLYARIVTSERHGMSQSQEYNSWRAMIGRCTNHMNKYYSYYGGRGIQVCDSWRENFEAFYNDMGERPKGTTLDRKDPNKGYYKDNCRWATSAEQAMNKRPRKNQNGYPGIYPNGSKWVARFKRNYIGTFDTITQASEAYQSARSEYLNRNANV